MAISEYKNNPIIWMNVTTSANWTRPPVGIVRVEQALCTELSAIFGADRFKTCVWMDGEFVEWVPMQDDGSEATDEVVDMILPRTASFNLARNFVARAVNKFKLEKVKGDKDFVNSLAINIPFSAKVRLKPAAGDVLISVGLDWDQPYTSNFFELNSSHGVKIITCCYDLIPVLFPQYCVGDVASRFKEYLKERLE